MAMYDIQQYGKYNKYKLWKNIIYIFTRKKCWMLLIIAFKYITVGRCCNAETYYTFTFQIFQSMLE